MDYITVKEFSSKNNLGVRAVQKMCKEGRIPDAKKISGLWMIPSDYQIQGVAISKKPKESVNENFVKEFLLDFAFKGKTDDIFDKVDKIMDIDDLKTKAKCLMLKSYSDFPNIKKMGEQWVKCRDMLKGTGITLGNFTLTFGGNMMLGIFLNNDGIADLCVRDFAKYIPVYDEIVGKKSGIDLLFETELEYMRGNIQKAEILAYKLYYTENLDWEVKLGLAKNLSNIALLMCNNSELELSQDIFEEVKSQCVIEEMKTSYEIAVSISDLIIYDEDSIPEWLQKGYFANKKLSHTTRLNAIFVHLTYLLRTKEYARTVAYCEKLIDEILNGAKYVTYYSLIYLYIIASISLYNLGYTEKGDDYLIKAIQLVKKDGLIMSLYDYALILGDNLDRVLSENDPEMYEKYCEINENFISNKRTMISSLNKEDLTDILTETEKEVAYLICDGLSNAEIAEKLFISQSTVNYHIRNIYSKVGAKRRTDMIKKLTNSNS